MSIASRIRSALSEGPMSRADLSIILGMTRRDLSCCLYPQIQTGLLRDLGDTIALGRLSQREDMAERERKAKLRAERKYARKQAKRRERAALRAKLPPKPKPERVPRVVLTPEQRRACNREQYRLKREAAGLPPRKVRTPEERREAKRLLNQRRYRPVSKVGGPAIKDSAKRIHSDTLRIAQQPVVSVDDFIRQHPERYQVLPGFQQVAPGPGQVHFAQRGRAA